MKPYSIVNINQDLLDALATYKSGAYKDMKNPFRVRHGKDEALSLCLSNECQPTIDINVIESVIKSDQIIFLGFDNTITATENGVLSSCQPNNRLSTNIQLRDNPPAKYLKLITRFNFNGKWRPKIRLKTNIVDKDKWSFQEAKNLTIGSDPEFSFFRDDTLISADQVLEDENWTNSVGLDGYSATGELRPHYGHSAEEHFNYLKETITELNEIALNENLSVDVIGNKHALGCHIHFGGLSGMSNQFYTFAPHLDKLLGKVLVPLSGTARRDYKLLGAIRPKEHGFEYRSLPALVLLDPEICKIILEIAYKTVKYAAIFTSQKRERFFSQPRKKIIEKFIGKEDYKKYSVFVRKYKPAVERQQAEMRLFDFWKLPQPKKSVKRLTINANDMFKDIIRTTLEEIFSGELKKNLYIYGVAEHRGLKYHFNFTPKTDINYPFYITENIRSLSGYEIGLPFAFRMDQVSESEMKSFFEDIKNIVKEICE